MKDLRLYRPDSRGERLSPEEDEYLTRLAQSVLGKEKPSAVPPASSRPPVEPPPHAAPDSRDRVSTSGRASAEQSPIPRRESHPSIARPKVEVAWEWVRDVELYDQSQGFLPGVILVFEDGSMGVFKEHIAEKEYDIVYMLRDSGRAVPQGMATRTYEVEPVGRLTHSCFENMVSSGKWDRDVILFHLLKFKDRSHIPVVASAPHSTMTSAEYVPLTNIAPATPSSSRAVRKPELRDPQTPAEPAERPTLCRGRRLTIDFGPSQKWDSVYWGKDELGHVVVHHTHDKWSIMHLDLGRFNHSLVLHEVVAPEVLLKIEKDITSATAG